MPTNPRPDDFDDTDPFADDAADNSSHADGDLEEIERRMNIHRLKNEANELAGGEMTSFEADEAPAEILEEFWENVVAFERAPLTTLHQKLESDGISMPADGDLDDAQLHEKLWQILRWSAENGAVYESTNHLSDRELYIWLRDDFFHQRENYEGGMTWHASPIGSYGAEEMVIYHRYYADEESRRDWARDYPEDEMPPREEPPFDRDKLLPW